jgi:hypothetical protein
MKPHKTPIKKVARGTFIETKNGAEGLLAGPDVLQHLRGGCAAKSGKKHPIGHRLRRLPYGRKCHRQGG